MRRNTESSTGDPDKFSITTMVYSAVTKENNDSFDSNIRNSIFLGKGVTTKEFLYGSK
ncbi:hypothetical protein NIES2100_70170 [Calothrix sp. NIES-2100]|nr:hypothetical protein NIES2100_70170 [Calothrix sp. NIES-2100]